MFGFSVRGVSVKVARIAAAALPLVSSALAQPAQLRCEGMFAYRKEGGREEGDSAKEDEGGETDRRRNC